MRLRSAVYVLAIIALAGVVGCSGGRTVTRIDPESTTDLSGRWNDTDSRLVAQAMISDCMARPWRSRHWEEKKKRPAIIVGRVRNESSEHIAVGTFIGDIERAFINSGDADIVASSKERGQIRSERADQQKYASEESMKQWGRELGADYMLTGVIHSIEDEEGGKHVTFYQVDLSLIDLERNTKVWQGQKKIKKFIGRGRYRP